jgi:hypothetical protein
MVESVFEICAYIIRRFSLDSMGLIEKPDSLCARVLRAKYYPQGNIIDTVFTGNPSSTWTAISYGLELLKKGSMAHWEW